MQLGIYVLRNTLKVSPHTRGDIFQITVPHNDEKTWWKCSDGDFTSNWDSFTCWLSIRAPNRRFLQRGLSKFFTVCNFGKSLAMSIIFFSKCWKFDLDSKNRKKKKKIQKNSFVFQIIAFELGIANFLNLQQNTFHRRPMC